MNILLFGFKKCGKTYYGLKVAQKLHMHFIDSDLLLEEYYEKIYLENLSYREIAKKHGFDFFRKLEQKILPWIMQQKNSIISLGGGMVLHPDNVARLQQVGTMVYLNVSKETLKQRLLSSEPPIYIDPHHPVESFETMYHARLPIYESISAKCLDIEGMTENQIIEALCTIVREASHHGK